MRKWKMKTRTITYTGRDECNNKVTETVELTEEQYQEYIKLGIIENKEDDNQS